MTSTNSISASGPRKVGRAGGRRRACACGSSFSAEPFLFLFSCSSTFSPKQGLGTDCAAQLLFWYPEGCGARRALDGATLAMKKTARGGRVSLLRRSSNPGGGGGAVSLGSLRGWGGVRILDDFFCQLPERSSSSMGFVAPAGLSRFWGRWGLLARAGLKAAWARRGSTRRSVRSDEPSSSCLNKGRPWLYHPLFLPHSGPPDVHACVYIRVYLLRTGPLVPRIRQFAPSRSKHNA